MKTGPRQERTPPIRIILAFLAASVLAVGTGCAHRPEAPEAARLPGLEPPPNERLVSAPAAYAQQLARIPGTRELAETYGVELVWLRLTARGSMLDLRYRVFDPELADALFGQGHHPKIFLVDTASDQTADVPQTMVGSLQQKAKRARRGRVYYVVFKNPSNSITAGAEVDLHFGDVTLEGVPVM